MGRRQREWAKRKREELIAKLGGKCQKCGGNEKLEFDHIDGRKEYTARDKDISWRMSIYAREATVGDLQLLCKRCNTEKGNKSEIWVSGESRSPF